MLALVPTELPDQCETSLSASELDDAWAVALDDRGFHLGEDLQSFLHVGLWNLAEKAIARAFLQVRRVYPAPAPTNLASQGPLMSLDSCMSWESLNKWEPRGGSSISTVNLPSHSSPCMQVMQLFISLFTNVSIPTI